MDKLQIMSQSSVDAMRNIFYQLSNIMQNSGLDQYHFILRFTDILLFFIVPILVMMMFFSVVSHPLYFISRKNNIVKLSWKKISHYYHFLKTAKILAENEHYGFQPTMDIILYKSHLNLFSALEIFNLGSKKFALFIPEEMWTISNDQLFATLLKPKVILRRRHLMFNTLIFFMNNVLNYLQLKTFNFITTKIKNEDAKNFLLISIYIFFLPLVYTRLSFRYHSYYHLMERLYGSEVANRLAQVQYMELNTFLNKPITYFFSLINEKTKYNS